MSANAALKIAKARVENKRLATSLAIFRKLVNAIRLLNTHEASYKHENGRYADRDQVLAFLRQTGLLSKSPFDLENPTPYELAITTTADGTHYQKGPRESAVKGLSRADSSVTALDFIKLTLAFQGSIFTRDAWYHPVDECGKAD